MGNGERLTEVNVNRDCTGQTLRAEAEQSIGECVDIFLGNGEKLSDELTLTASGLGDGDTVLALIVTITAMDGECGASAHTHRTLLMCLVATESAQKPCTGSVTLV